MAAPVPPASFAIPPSMPAALDSSQAPLSLDAPHIVERSAAGIERDPPQPRRAHSAPSSDSSEGIDTEDAVYARAHRAHFVEHEAAAALAAWDSYLASYPRGRYAIEARYNRGIALVRLRQWSKARAALLPFANGELGGYRQHEAEELIEALPSSLGDAGR